MSNASREKEHSLVGAVLEPPLRDNRTATNGDMATVNEYEEGHFPTHCPAASQSRATAAVQDWSREPRGSPVNGS